MSDAMPFHEDRSKWITLTEQEWSALHTAKNVLKRVSERFGNHGDKLTVLHAVTAIDLLCNQQFIEVRR